jgi:hypothetical protein
MKSLRLILPAATLLAALLSTSALSFGTPAFSKKEGKKPCVTCHEKGKATKENPLLNATGKYYKEKKTLEGAPK